MTRPNLISITEADLKSVERLADLFSQAAMMKAIPRTRRSWFEFVALACHANRVGKDPPALFASNLYNKRWTVIGITDETSALNMLQGAEDDEPNGID